MNDAGIYAAHATTAALVGVGVLAAVFGAQAARGSRALRVRANWEDEGGGILFARFGAHGDVVGYIEPEWLRFGDRARRAGRGAHRYVGLLGVRGEPGLREVGIFWDQDAAIYAVERAAQAGGQT